MIGRRFRRALTDNRAATDPSHPDPDLRGRTYAVPFERVWRASLHIAGERRGWTVTRQDDMDGVIEIEASTRIFGFVDDVAIRIVLDENAQTRVDATSESRKGKADFGTNARRLRRFFRDLDERVVTEPRRAARA